MYNYINKKPLSSAFTMSLTFLHAGAAMFFQDPIA